MYFIAPLQKPGKAKGPIKNLRPLTLLNGARKILSLITLKRVEHQIYNYTGAWQCAYKQGRSCADLVWAQRILVSVVLRKEWQYTTVGIDMSAAFDTICRGTIINLLKDAGCSQDDIRLVQYLLSSTKLRVRVNNNISAEFETTLGSFQGDSLSGKLFTLCLAGALNHLRVVTLRPNPPILPNGFPTEWEYADDVDFSDEDPDTLDAILSVAKNILSEWNLFMNEEKTEKTLVYITQKNEVNSDGNPIYGNEGWRTRKALGSLLCTIKDIECIVGVN